MKKWLDQPYMAVTNRKTLDEKYGVDVPACTNIHIGSDGDEISQFLEDFFLASAWEWYFAAHPLYTDMDRSSNGEKIEQVGEKLVSHLFDHSHVHIVPLMREDTGSYLNMGLDYNGTRFVSGDFRNEIFDPESTYLRTRCYIGLLRYVTERKTIEEENKKSEEKVAKRNKSLRETAERELYEKLKAKFSTFPTEGYQ